MEKEGKRNPGEGRKPGGQSRRDFLKSGTLAGAAGLLTPGCGLEKAGRLVSTAGRPVTPGPEDIVLENRQARLIIGPDGMARSLWHKGTGQECLAPGTATPVFFGDPVPPLRERAAAQVSRQVQDLPGPFGPPEGRSVAAGIRAGRP